jgi:hypothetical protein
LVQGRSPLGEVARQRLRSRCRLVPHAAENACCAGPGAGYTGHNHRHTVMVNVRDAGDSMVKTARIADKDLLTAAEEIIRDFNGHAPWWRGHAVAGWALVPSVYRDDRAKHEQDLVSRFQLRAGTRHGRCPQHEDAPAWLFLMQHYGLPTRLLDWSEALLVAAYYVIENPTYDDEDGAIWALDAGGLNQLHGHGPYIYGPRSPEIAPLFNQPFNRYADSDERIVAVGTEEMDPRQMVQQSAFTLHGTPVGLDRSAGTGDVLRKLVVPKEDKDALRRTLRLLGIHQASLYPDLQNLAAFLDDTVCRGL